MTHDLQMTCWYMISIPSAATDMKKENSVYVQKETEITF